MHGLKLEVEAFGDISPAFRSFFRIRLDIFFRWYSVIATYISFILL